MIPSRVLRLGGALVAACMVACVAPAESLDDVRFTEGAVLDSHRDVSLRVEGRVPPGLGRASVVVPGEGVRFEGPFALLAERGLRLRVAPHVAALEVRFVGPGGAVRRQVEIESNGAAVLSLGGVR